MIFKRNCVTIFSILFLTLAIPLSYLPNHDFLAAKTSFTAAPRIILDAGHGGLTNTID